jgi:hypothetical protein
MTVRRRKEKPMEKIPAIFKIARDLHHKLKVHAVQEGTTMSEITEKLIADYLKRKGVK